MPLLSRERLSSPALSGDGPVLGERAGWRIMKLITGLSADGGAEVQTVQLALRLKKRGWDVSLVSLRQPVSIPPALAEAGIEVSSAGVRDGKDVFAGLLRLIRLVRERRPHILHSHMTHAALAARAVRVIQRVPVVIGTLHGLRMYNVSGTGFKGRELMYRLSDRLSDLTTAVCGAAASYYAQARVVAPERLRVVANGVDVDTFRPDPQARDSVRRELGVDGEFVWLSVGRFVRVKDHAGMLRAFARFRVRHPRSLLLMAGAGRGGEHLRRLASELGIQDSVRFLGTRTDIPNLMNAADGLVLSSKFEALPMVLLEAGACALPAVATRVGGNPEVIADGVTGFLAPVGDPAALAETMSRLASLPCLERQRLGQAARERIVREYRFDAVIDQWEALYWSLLAARKEKL